MSIEIPKFGFDIDGVVADIFPILCKNIYSATKIFIDPSEIRKFNIQLDTVPDEAIEECVNITIRDQESIYPYIETVEFIRYYYEDSGHIPTFITSRNSTKPGIAKATIDWLHRIFYPTPFEVSFANNHDKASIIINKEVNIFIEDRAKNATEISEKEVCVLLIDRPWNQHAVENKYLARVDSWDFIKDFYYKRCSRSRLLFKKF